MINQPVEKLLRQLTPFWQKHPEAFMRDVLRFDPWHKQEEICQLVTNNQRVAVYTCHGIGKTTLAAHLSLWFLNCFYNSIVITTAPTFRQVENQIWRNIRGARARSLYDLGGKLTNTKLELGENWYALGVSSNDPDNVQGFHAEDILILCDEASGIPDELFDAIDGSLTSGNIHLVLLGNPTSSSGTFCNSTKNILYKSLRISVFDSPNFIHNGITCTKDLYKFETFEEVQALPLIKPGLVTPAWAWGRLHTWGEDSAPYQSRVEGLFPTEDASTLLPMAWVTRAIEKEWTDEEKQAMGSAKSIGVDVARFGDDETVITVFKGMRHIATYNHHGKDTMKTVGLIREVCRKHKYNEASDFIVIDDTGVGGGVTDRLNELDEEMPDGHGYNVVAVNFGGRPTDHQDMKQDGEVRSQYLNIKAEMFWNLRLALQNDEISLRDDGRIYAELPSIRYSYNSNGKLIIESKNELKKRAQRSPDYADSVALAVWGVVQYCQGSASIPDDDDEDEDDNTIAGNLYSQTL